MKTLSLSDRQLHIVREAAKSVPIEYRDRFLQNLADWLLTTDVTDESVSRAALTVAANMLGNGRCCE